MTTFTVHICQRCLMDDGRVVQMSSAFLAVSSMAKARYGRNGNLSLCDRHGWIVRIEKSVRRATERGKIARQVRQGEILRAMRGLPTNYRLQEARDAYSERHQSWD